MGIGAVAASARFIGFRPLPDVHCVQVYIPGRDNASRRSGQSRLGSVLPIASEAPPPTPPASPPRQKPKIPTHPAIPHPVTTILLQPTSLSASKRALAQHPIYTAIRTLPQLRTFTEHHVAAVFDFMTLLKSLQRDLAPVTTPWLPPVDPEAARLINEIVVDEESDALPYREGHASHFVWYTEAMEELGADTGPVWAAVAAMRAGERPLLAMERAGMPAAAREFVATTLSFLDEPLAVRAAVFLHGREELIPQMFMPLVASMRTQGLPCERFLAYLQRHIEVDGGAHGQHAAALLERLCAREPALKERGERAALQALAARQRLWDAIVAGLPAAE